MNAGLESNHVSIHYYDGDYPSKENSIYPENFDQTTVFQGLAHDVARYKEIASEVKGPVLELCCGSGRVAIPLASTGFEVTGVDISRGILDQFRVNLEREKPEVAKRVSLVEQDITQLSLSNKDYRFAFIAFNSLLCIPDFGGQIQALKSIGNHLATDGLLVIDIVNPLKLKSEGDSVPKAFFTRKNPHNGNSYTRFAMTGPFDENHRQKLHGWYDEINSDGAVRRRHYELFWRPIYRFEIELMLKEAGFRIQKIEGGHQKENYTADSPRMFIQARKGR